MISPSIRSRLDAVIAGRPITSRRLAALPDRIFNEGYQPDAQALYLRRAEGCEIEDFDGNTFIDLGLGAGSAILGHAHPDVVSAITAQAARGTVYIAPHMAVHDFGALLAGILPAFGGFVFCNSGAEATLRAMRIARAVTGRRRVAVFSGGWHGGHDLALADEAPNSPAQRPIPIHRTAGTPPELLDLLLFLPYNAPEALELIRTHRHELALVLIEPAQGSNPRVDVGGFLRDLRQVTEECGVLLGFDEIITGFRLALGGGQEAFGVIPDIATYGKIIGGGLPVGMVAGKTEVMRRIRGGNNVMSVFMGGTFSANPLTIAAGLAAVRHLSERRETVYPALDAAFGSLRDAVNDFCSARGLPVRMINAGSFGRLLFTDRPVSSRHERDLYELGSEIQNAFYLCLLAAGVHVGSNRILFLSTAHDDTVVDAVTRAFIETLGDFDQEGVFAR